MNRMTLLYLPLFVLFFISGCITLDVEPEEQLATLEIENSSPYEIKHIYAKNSLDNEWGMDLLKNKSILPFSSSYIKVPGGSYKLKAEVLVNNEMITVEDGLDFTSGKQYLWTISEEAWLSMFRGNGSYEYMDTYGYANSYGYLDSYEYMDTYGYM